MEFLQEMSVWSALLVVVSLIIVNALFGGLKAMKRKSETFDLRKLPEFVATDILPYIGGMFILALMAEMVGRPYVELFYVVAVLVGVAYSAKINDKAFLLFGLKND
ncbi:MAG: hypothetical protein QMD11_05535 [Smithella sp.]|nr:hypothetical protein [Smithella sp.]